MTRHGPHSKHDNDLNLFNRGSTLILSLVLSPISSAKLGQTSTQKFETFDIQLLISTKLEISWLALYPVKGQQSYQCLYLRLFCFNHKVVKEYAQFEAGFER